MRHTVLRLLFMTTVLSGCTESESTPVADSNPSTDVVVTCEPLRQICVSMLPDSMAVISIDNRPDVQQIQRMQRSALIVVQGSGHEPWLVTLTLPPSIVFTATDAIKAAVIERRGVVKHQHGPSGAGDGISLLTCTWTAPKLFGKQVEALGQRLARTFPDDADSIVKQQNLLLNKIEGIEAIAASIRKNQSIDVSIDEPELAYFAAACGFQIVEPEAADLHLTSSKRTANTTSPTVFVDLFRARNQEAILETVAGNFRRLEAMITTLDD